MSKANWPAFPAMHFDLKENEQGITIRDYFAAKAMHAILCDPNYMAEDRKLAEAAYFVADAMLKAREQ